MPHPMSTLTMRMRPCAASFFVRGAAALMLSCTSAMARPRETNCGTKRKTCETMSVTTGAAFPNSASEFSESMQAEYDANHRNTDANMPPEHRPYKSASA